MEPALTASRSRLFFALKRARTSSGISRCGALGVIRRGPQGAVAGRCRAGLVAPDLSPRTEISDHPVKISTKYHGGLSFAITAVPVHPDVTAERTTEEDVYFPTVTVSGVGFSYAIWDFTAVGDAPLIVDRELRLLATVPASAAEVPARVTLRALVTARGFLGKIPLVGRQNAVIPLA
jgi:hypothetical protein